MKWFCSLCGEKNSTLTIAGGLNSGYMCCKRCWKELEGDSINKWRVGVGLKEIKLKEEGV